MSIKNMLNVTLGTVLAAGVLMTPSVANAERIYTEDQLWDKGRSYGTFLLGTNVNRETNVISASSKKQFYGTSNWIDGVERVRAWSRLDNVNQVYPAPYYTNWVNSAALRMYSDDSRRNYLYISGANPPDASSSSTLDEIVYDILGFAGVPSDTIKAYVNNFLVSGISTSGLGSYDVLKTFKGVSGSKVNLSNSIYYRDADKSAPYSSAQVEFSYQIKTSNNTAFYLWPQVKIQYGHSYQGGFPYYSWTNYAGVRHTVN